MGIDISIKQRLFQIAEIVHLRVFGHAMSDEMRKFLGNLSWSFFGGIVAAGILFCLNILVGRMLGPEEYGRYNIILLLSQALVVPILFGLDTAVIRALSRSSSDIVVQRNTVLNGAFFLLVSMFFISLVVIIFRNYLSVLFTLPIELINLSLILGVSVSLKLLLDGIARGTHSFRVQALAKFFESGLIVLIILSTFLFYNKSSLIVLVSILIGAWISILFYMYHFWYLFKVWDFHINHSLLSYSKIALIASMASLIFSYGDRFLVNKYFGAEEFGIYSAYYVATIFLISQIASLVTNVFFPVVSSVENKTELLKKIDLLFIRGIIPVALLVFFAGGGVLLIFGQAYRMDPLALSLFSLIAALQLFELFYAGLANSHNEISYSRSVLYLVIRSVMYILYISLLFYLNIFSVIAVLLGLFLNYAINIYNLRTVILRYVI